MRAQAVYLDRIVPLVPPQGGRRLPEPPAERQAQAAEERPVQKSVAPLVEVDAAVRRFLIEAQAFSPIFERVTKENGVVAFRFVDQGAVRRAYAKELAQTTAMTPLVPRSV